MKRTLVAAVAAASFMLAGCSSGTDNSSATEASDPGSDSGTLEASLGEEIVSDEVVISVSLKGTGPVIDREEEYGGQEAHGFKLEVENRGDTTFDGSNSFINAVATDEGSGQQVDGVDNDDETGYIEQLGSGTKGSITLWFVLPEGATKATVSAQVGSADDSFPVTFSGEIEE